MAQKSGRIPVATAGSAVAGPSVDGQFMLQPSPGNAGAYCYVGDDGSGNVSSATGFTLEKGASPVVVTGNLADFRFDVDTDGDEIEWLLVATYGKVESPGVP